MSLALSFPEDTPPCIVDRGLLLRLSVTRRRGGELAGGGGGVVGLPDGGGGARCGGAASPDVARCGDGFEI